MKLELFEMIDQTIDLLNRNIEEYKVIRKELKYTLLSILDKELALDITSRIKSGESLREKIIRNQYYLKFDTPQAIIDNLSDLIGLKVDCRFIEDEFKIYRDLKFSFTTKLEDGFYTCETYPYIALDLEPYQPQSQRNGFAIYRVDGYYINGDHKVRFELQIKSLVNSFWGDIEHKLVYKNTTYIAYDFFMKDLLASIKANLTIVDRQLHIIHDAMADNNVSNEVLNRLSFESLIAKAINDLCAEKLKNAIGFSIDIRGTSKILGYFIFKKNIQSANNNDQFVGLLQLFGRLNSEDIDFENQITMEERYQSKDVFCEVLGDYLLQQMNIDFEWFVFFRILFAVEPGNNVEDFKLFLKVLKGNVIDEEQYNTLFTSLSTKDATQVKDACMKMLAEGLCTVNSIQIVHNDMLQKLQTSFYKFMCELDERVMNYADFKHYEDAYREELHSIINSIFHKKL